MADESRTTPQPAHIHAPLLHVYAQPVWHEDAFIVGNRAALEDLRRAINTALSTGSGTASAFVSDGEGYDCNIQVDDTPWEGGTWPKRAVPYTDEPARETHSDAVWPGPDRSAIGGLR